MSGDDYQRAGATISGLGEVIDYRRAGATADKSGRSPTGGDNYKRTGTITDGGDAYRRVGKMLKQAVMIASWQR